MSTIEAHPLSTLRQRSSEKWGTYPTDVLPMFVAEMDFPLAPAIKATLGRAIELGDTGYINPLDAGAAEAFGSYAASRWGWRPSPDRMRYAADVSVVIVESLRRLLQPGDGVVLNPPVYAPFYDLVLEGGGSVIEVPLLKEHGTYQLDVDGIERALMRNARVVLLCNPQNPVGLVHSRQTLAALSHVVARRRAHVISDEIHAPLTHHAHEFVPYLSVSHAARSHGIAAASASKAFNLAGLKCAMFVTDSDRMAALLRALPQEIAFRAGLFGLLGTRAGFTDCQDWLESTVTTVEANFALLDRQLADKLPAVRLHAAQATYLAWLDMSSLGWGENPAVFAAEAAKVALSSGPSFGSGGAGHARMNLACAPETIIEAIDRLAAVDRKRQIHDR